MSEETVMLLVGADNETGMLDMPRIESVVSKRHSGFTTWQTEGHWEGSAEDSAAILLSDDHDSIMATVADLKSELRQDAIGIEQMPATRFA
jgi:hypothetical protein